MNGVFTLDAGVHVAHAAAEQLSDRSVEAKVIDMRSLIPLDSETIFQSVRKTSRAVVIDIAPRAFGFIKEIDVLDGKEAFDYLDAPVLHNGPPMVPVPFSASLEPLVTPKTEEVVDTVLRELSR